MSLIPEPEELEAWRGVLTRRFIAASQTEEAYVEGARAAHQGAVKWVHSDVSAKEKGSFRWTCDLLGLEPSAVRRALKERDPTALEQLL